ncbi:MAG: 2-oxoglutarate dehydrogenase E1 component [Pseudomonadota bacterium]
MSDSLQKRYENSPLFGANAPLVETLYEQYLADPQQLDPAWRDYFAGIANGANGEIPHGPIRDALAARALQPQVGAGSAAGSTVALEKQSAVLRLIWAYRLHGHKLANLDPLGLLAADSPQDLDPASHGLGESDLDTEFFTEGLAGTTRLKLREILALARRIYTRRIGIEYAHISNVVERQWLREHVEISTVEAKLSAERKRDLLAQLTAAEGIERYLHTRYVGQKRFSLEGGESLIPLLHSLIGQAGDSGIRELVIGMAHRGRINVLVNVLGKPPAELFSEFEGLYQAGSQLGTGDVKYHLGFSTDIPVGDEHMHVVLAFNPSHLEIVNPVVAGSVRARQDRRKDSEGQAVLPVLIHGDAAFSGQGVVMETLQMSRTPGFQVGGTVHVICNNQIGFTTSNPADARSTPYASDVAKMLEAPVFHVNGNDPEAVHLVTQMAFDYRKRFGRDAVIDLVCYRRHGHNEADEPSATQPVMYRAIRDLKPVRRMYAEQLMEEGVVDQDFVRDQVDEYRQALDDGRIALISPREMVGNEHTVDWSPYFAKGGQEETAEVQRGAQTDAEAERLQALGTQMLSVPEHIKLHPRVQRVYDDRRKMLAGDHPLDWGFCETLAYATLLNEGYDVRLVGQDSGRGTFFHRHAVLHHQADNELHVPLQHLDGPNSTFEVYDSLLSEEAVLGFEYGYSTTDPNTLVIWEAQFGDFANGAQVVIDQFISSGEAKWNRLCGLALFLPHGHEGQGPEHSSARLERFMQLCAQGNMQVCVPSTPAQMFHMLRRQMRQPMRRPLVVMTPKSLLRHPLSVSALDELSSGRFELMIDETELGERERVRRVVMCSGKVYYDLLKSRQEMELGDVALVRLEQLYPFPDPELNALLASYPNAKELVWCQEEPRNQGAFYQIRHRLQRAIQGRDITLTYAGRAPMAAPAVGYYRRPVDEQTSLVSAALGASPTEHVDRRKEGNERD